MLLYNLTLQEFNKNVYKSTSSYNANMHLFSLNIENKYTVIAMYLVIKIKHSKEINLNGNYLTK